MITRVIPIGELKSIYGEILLNKTSKITKISDESVVNGVAFGVAKIGQRAIKDIALIESHLFPDAAFGIHLDQVAENLGIAPRYGAAQSSTYLRVYGQVGTQYIAGTHIFKGQGVAFEPTSNFTIGSEGYGYIKVRSQTSGLKTNVPSLTINEVSPTPVGHEFVTNEYAATGGKDFESDENLKTRIKRGPNICSKNTLEYITQVFLKFNENVFRVYNYGTNDQNQSILAIATQNGIDLTQSELDLLLDQSKTYLSFTDYNNASNASIGVKLINIEYHEIDIEFRCSLVQSTQVDEIRKNIQVSISKYFDYRFWETGQKIEWDDLLQVVKQNEGIKYVADRYFKPSSDIEIKFENLPRVRGFKMMDLDGNLIIDNSGVLNPIFYPEIAQDIQNIL